MLKSDFKKKLRNLIPRQRVFTHAPEHRSESENGLYSAVIIKALKNEKSFDNFKQQPQYRKILEHVSEYQGGEYLKILESRDDGILESAIGSILTSDSIGNPVKFKYGNYSNPFSPTTLRYTKVTSDIYNLFGKSFYDVVEVGCGYGGQALAMDQLLSIHSITLLDLPVVNELIEKYLNNHLFNGSYRTSVINKEKSKDYDLVISNYAFSELPRQLQKVYINKILKNCRRGYLTMNSGMSGARNQGKLTLNEMRALMPEFEVIEEQPLTSPHNYLIVWGHSQDAIPRLLKRFEE